MEKQQCSICLARKTVLTTLRASDLHEKLKVCVPEVQWSQDEAICAVCRQQVDSVYAFRSQCINSHKPVKQFRCEKCGRCFNKSSHLKQHNKYHEGNRDNVCSFCGKGFVMRGDLLTHEKKHLNRREYSCELCPKQFNTHKDLRSHKLIVHSDPSSWNFTCAICGKKFPIKTNHDQHVRRHAGEKRFECHLCDKKFVDKVVLKRHITSHSNVRAFKCEHCSSEYKEKKRLEVHLKKVHGVGDAKLPDRVKKHCCQLCPKAYYAKNKLTRHINTHAGVKPFACDVCNKRFMDKYYVKQHLKNAHCDVTVKRVAGTLDLPSTVKRVAGSLDRPT